MTTEHRRDSTAVIQVKQGIGDVIWHLPFIRAIAAAEPAGAVTFLTLPSSYAKDLLQAEPCVAEVIYFEHGGSELRRGLHLMRLVTLLRRARFRRVWILDRTVRPALAAALARRSATHRAWDRGRSACSSPMPGSIGATSMICRSTGCAR